MVLLLLGLLVVLPEPKQQVWLERCKPGLPGLALSQVLRASSSKLLQFSYALICVLGATYNSANTNTWC